MKNKKFYENIDRSELYTADSKPEEHAFYPILVPFIKKWSLAKGKKCLEIGSSKGLFQDFVEDYTGADLAKTLAPHYHKPFVPCNAAQLPFKDGQFDAAFTYATHEHVPELEDAMEELVRVVKPGGVILFAPAWHTRSWFAGGYAVRPYSDLGWKEKLIKFSIPFRDFFMVRYSLVFGRRLIHLIDHLLSKRPRPLRYKKLDANYEVFWQSDSDACNSLDPFDVILWCRERGIRVVGYESLGKAFLVRAYGLELVKPQRG